MDHPTLHNGRDKRVPPGSEGHACHARGSGVDYPTRCGGPDKRVPPKGKSEGHARRARRRGMDHPTLPTGRDKRIPPKERRRTTVVLPVEAKNEAVGTRTRDLRIKSPLHSVLSDVCTMHYDDPMPWVHSWVHHFFGLRVGG